MVGKKNVTRWTAGENKGRFVDLIRSNGYFNGDKDVQGFFISTVVFNASFPLIMWMFLVFHKTRHQLKNKEMPSI